MSTTTITTAISTEVDLQTGTFGSNLMVLPAGKVTLTAQASAGEIRTVYMPSQDTLGTILNFGTISALTIGESPGGEAIVMNTTGSIINSGLINGNLFGVLASNGGFIGNSGRIISQTEGIALLSNGLISNSGTIYGGQDGISLKHATLSNSGSVLSSEYGVYLSQDSFLKNMGFITGSVAISLPDGGTIINAGSIFGDIARSAGGALALTVDPGAQFSGLVVDTVGKGSLTLAGTNNSLLQISDFVGFSSIDFSKNSRWILEGTSSQISNGQTISGFTNVDEIILDNFVATSETAVDATHLVVSNGTESLTLNLTGTLNAATFLVTPNASGGTDITAPCFSTGTLITTSLGKIKVEELKVGDLVQTLSRQFLPIRWIGRRNYFGRKTVNSVSIQPVCVKKNAFGDNIPSRDLVVSPDHSFYFDGRLVKAFLLTNDISVIRVEDLEFISYFHVELDRHEIIFAEDCPTESYLEADCRQRFETTKGNPVRATSNDSFPLTCFPRVEDGFDLYRIKTIINFRQNISSNPGVMGPLRGCLDEIGPEVVRGWIQDMTYPERPVMVEILVDGQVEVVLLANKYRRDLKHAGLGSGCHAFEYWLPRRGHHNIQVQRISDKARLPPPSSH